MNRDAWKVLVIGPMIIGMLITLLGHMLINEARKEYVTTPIEVPKVNRFDFGPGTHDPTKYNDPSDMWVDCEGDCID